MSAPQLSSGRLEARGLSVALADRTIVQQCSFSIAAGEFVAVVGPNGAGKTTLMRALAGLLPFSGDLRLNGEDSRSMGLIARACAISYLPQNGQVHWPMCVRDVVALGRLPFGASPQKINSHDDALVTQAMQDCDLLPFAATPVTDLSGGELARVLLARVLATDAPVILADEPTASLDPAHRIAVMELLVRKAAAGKSVIAVSHDIGLAANYASRMIVIANGSIAGDGPPSELLDSGLMQRIFGVRFHRFDIDGTIAYAIAPRA